MNTELTILMPCLNEKNALPFAIAEAKECIKKYNLSAEILIADNGSTDGSVGLAESLGARVVQIEPRGYGATLIGGIADAKGKYIIMGDCDGSYNFMDAHKILELLRKGNGLVVGNRFKGGIEKGAMPPLHNIGVPFLSFLGRIKYGVKIKDFHCGLRGFDKDKALSLSLKSSGMEFATEIIAKFARSGAKICETSTILRKDKRCGKPHLRTFRDGFRHLIYIIKN